MRLLGLLLTCAIGLGAVGADLPSPTISRVSPLGGQAGTTIDVTILGEYLSNARSVEFDCLDLKWTRTRDASSGRLEGTIAIASGTPLGSHLLRVRTAEGRSNSALFNVGQFPDLAETEPNDRIGQRQVVSETPVEIQGVLEGAADVDIYAVEARAGERWVIDLRSIEYGSAVEAKMFLLDPEGRQVDFNDDRDDYLESPLIDHTFEQGGRHFIKIDQYRGPRGFNFGKSSTYILRISSLPTIRYASPLGAATGDVVSVSLWGSGLASVNRMYLTEVRGAEYRRMTYPYTMPIHFRADPADATKVSRIEGRVKRANPDRVEAVFKIPPDVRTGLWQIWAAGAAGVADGPMFELARFREHRETDAARADWRTGGYVINGVLSEPAEKDIYAVHVVAGSPLHFWTLAAQLGVPHLDSVLSLRDSSGKKLAESDDVVAGQGSLLGNPDSSLFYTPEDDGVVFLVVEDRTARGGPSYHYRLKVQSERPGFQLFTTPENFAVPRGGEAEIKVHLIREQGFEGAVSFWFDEMPGGVEAPRGKFRTDQLFEPNADGADMIIPEVTFRIAVPSSVPSGTYPIRVLGTPTAEESNPNRRMVEAGTTMIQGPLLDLWNFVRRPLPRIEMTVVEPLDAQLLAADRTVTLFRGGHAPIVLTAWNLPENSEMRVVGLPQGVSFDSSRHGDQVTVMLEAASQSDLGSFDISVEARVGERWVATGVISLSVLPSRLRAGN